MPEEVCLNPECNNPPNAAQGLCWNCYKNLDLRAKYGQPISQRKKLPGWKKSPRQLVQDIKGAKKETPKKTSRTQKKTDSVIINTIAEAILKVVDTRIERKVEILRKEISDTRKMTEFVVDDMVKIKKAFK